MPKISVIVPVYNVEKYFERCITSILRQTFTDFEVILVDDGSTDGSGELCDKYAEQDDRVIVIHKENGGLSSARNAGIDIARGEYLTFVDSDDYIAEDMCQVLYENLVREKADMSLCGLYDCFLGKTPIKLPEYYSVVDVRDAVRIVMEAQIVSVTAVGKLYKKSLFGTLRYPIGKQAEDAFVMIDLLLQCRQVVITSEQKYYYFHRENSITTKAFNKHDYDVIEAYHKNFDLIMKHYPDLEDVGRMRLCWAHFWVLDKMLLAEGSKPAERKEIIKYLRNNAFFIIHNKVFTRGRKLAFLALLINWRLYRVFVQRYMGSNRKSNY